MDRLRNQILLCVFLISLILLQSRPATSQEVEDEKDFNYMEGSEHGPDNWGTIHPEWEMCKEGNMQSPIDLLNEKVEVVSHLGRFKRSYKPSNATVKNRGHDIMLKWEGHAGFIEINGTEYLLQQCHWHSPAEHTFNGKRFDLELHMVHESLDKKIAVVGITYIIGRPDPFLAQLMDHIGDIASIKEEERDVGVLNPKEIKFGSRKYYRYIGSLTIPPCTQDVVWTIVRKVRTVSREQVRLLRDAVHDDSNRNSRPVQPMGKHTVKLYRPDDQQNN